MRIVWLLIVILVIAWTLFNNLMGGLGVKSAVQASQLADQTSATMLILIAITLAFWFVADERPEAAKSADAEPAVRPSAPASAPADEPVLTKPCRACGKAIHRDAVSCRYCGIAQPN